MFERTENAFYFFIFFFTERVYTKNGTNWIIACIKPKSDCEFLRRLRNRRWLPSKKERYEFNKITVVCTVDCSNGTRGEIANTSIEKFLRTRTGSPCVVDWIESDPGKLYGYWVSWRAGGRFTDIRNDIFLRSETPTVGLSETNVLDLYTLTVCNARNTNNCQVVHIMVFRVVGDRHGVWNFAVYSVCRCKRVRGESSFYVSPPPYTHSINAHLLGLFQPTNRDERTHGAAVMVYVAIGDF